MLLPGGSCLLRAVNALGAKRFDLSSSERRVCVCAQVGTRLEARSCMAKSDEDGVPWGGMPRAGHCGHAHRSSRDGRPELLWLGKIDGVGLEIFQRDNVQGVFVC